MYRHAAKSAAQSNSSLKAPGMASLSFGGRNRMCPGPSFHENDAARTWAAIDAILCRLEREDGFGALGKVLLRFPSSARGHASGPTCALRQAHSSASRSAPFGLRFPSPTDPP
jgi:hypothetical protein